MEAAALEAEALLARAEGAEILGRLGHDVRPQLWRTEAQGKTRFIQGKGGTETSAAENGGTG